MNTPSFIFFTNIVPEYRSSFFKSLACKSPVFIFRNSIDNSIGLTQVKRLTNTTLYDLKFIRFFGLTFHLFPLRYLIFLLKNRNSYFIFDGNIRHPVYILISVLLFLFRKNISVWSSDNHEQVAKLSFFRNIRIFYWKIFNNYFFYHPKDIKTLYKYLNLSSQNSIAIGNGLLPAKNIPDFCSCEECIKVKNFVYKKTYIASIARLDKNRFENITTTLSSFVNDVNCYWLIAGTGSTEHTLRSLVKNNYNIILIGELTCDTAQKTFISNSVFIMHEGTVGLHVLNAYRFNKRILIPSDSNFYSVEAQFCIELPSNRYDKSNLLSLLYSYFYSPRLPSSTRDILLNNNTLSMSQSIIDYFNSVKKL